MKTDNAPSFAAMRDNVLALFDNASDEELQAGYKWYDVAQTFALGLSVKYNVSLEVAASVIAVYSQNQRWAGNMTMAENHLAGNPRGLRAAIEMADRAIYWENNATYNSPFDAVVGPKINPFAYAIAGDLSKVATDRWAQRAAFNTLDDKQATKWIRRNGVRQMMIDAYVSAAHIRNVEPAIMQAVVWVVIRGGAD